MVWNILIMVGCLAVPAGNARAWETPPPGSADLLGLHSGGATRSHDRPAASRAGRQSAAPCTAVLGDIDDDETEEDSPTVALPPAGHPKIGRAWMRTLARPGSGQVLQYSTARIPLRC